MELSSKFKEARTELEKERRNLSDRIKSYSASFQSNQKWLKTPPEYIKIGNITKGGYKAPAMFPLADIKGIAFELNETNRDELNRTIESLALQIISQMDASYYDFTIFDARKMGNNFKFIRRIKDAIVDSEEVKSAVSSIYNESIRVMNECVVNYDNIEEYNSATSEKQPFRFLFIADFPYGFKESFEKVSAILNTAKESGLFIFMTYDASIDTGISSNKEYFKEILSNLVQFKETDQPKDIYRITNIPNQEFYNKEFKLMLDRDDIDPEKIKNMVSGIQTFTKKELCFDYKYGVRIPIGKCAGETHYLTMGHETDVSDAIIGGQSGKGKTTLLNNIIVGGMKQYSPKELTFELIDCSGVGFQAFKDSTYVSAFYSSSQVDDCLPGIQFLDEEMSRREALFKEYKVDKLSDLITKLGKPIPRLICMIDEFHVLFTGTMKTTSYIESVLVDRAIRIGRKFGVHLIVSTQSLGGNIRRSILDNIPLRLAMGMTADQSANFLGFKNEAAANLERGLVVYNGENGAPRANKIVRVPYITPDELEKAVSITNKKK